MDPHAKLAFRSGCLAALFVIGVIMAGSWLAMIEFGASFHETQQDRISRIIAWALIIVFLSAFIVTLVMFKSNRKYERHVKSSSNPELDGTPWANNSGFTFDADNPNQNNKAEQVAARNRA